MTMLVCRWSQSQAFIGSPFSLLLCRLCHLRLFRLGGPYCVNLPQHRPRNVRLCCHLSPPPNYFRSLSERWHRHHLDETDSMMGWITSSLVGNVKAKLKRSPHSILDEDFGTHKVSTRHRMCTNIQEVDKITFKLNCIIRHLWVMLREMSPSIIWQLLNNSASHHLWDFFLEIGFLKGKEVDKIYQVWTKLVQQRGALVTSLRQPAWQK